MFRKTIESMCFSLCFWKLYLQLDKTLPNCLLEQSREGRDTGSLEWYFSSSLENSPSCYQWVRVVRPGCTQMFRSSGILEFLFWRNSFGISQLGSAPHWLSPHTASSSHHCWVCYWPPRILQPNKIIWIALVCVSFIVPLKLLLPLSIEWLHLWLSIIFLS